MWGAPGRYLGKGPEHDDIRPHRNSAPTAMVECAKTRLLDLPLLFAGLQKHLQLAATAQLRVSCLHGSGIGIELLAQRSVTNESSAALVTTCHHIASFWCPMAVLLFAFHWCHGCSRAPADGQFAGSDCKRNSLPPSHHAVDEDVQRLLPLDDELRGRLVFLHDILLRNWRHDDACGAAATLILSRNDAGVYAAFEAVASVRATLPSMSRRGLF